MSNIPRTGYDATYYSKVLAYALSSSVRNEKKTANGDKKVTLGTLIL